jgi:hypothetical protein
MSADRARKETQMKRRLVIAIGIVAAWAVGAARTAAPQGGPTVRLMGLQVIRSVSEADEDQAMMLAPPGTVLTMLVSSAGKRILGVNREASKLTAFTDDKGMDLGRKPENPDPANVRVADEWWLGPHRPLAVRSGGCLVQVQTDHLPAAGATRIIFRANLVLECGANERTVRQEGLPLRNSAAITVGPVPLRITGVEDVQDAGGMKMDVTFEHAKSLNVVKGIRFIGPDGQPIESTYLGRMEMGPPDDPPYQTVCRLARKVDKVTVEITYYDQIEKLNVPVDLAATVGL